MPTRSNAAIRKHRVLLKALQSDNSGSIRADVANTALSDNPDDPAQFFEDLARIGCVSGMVSHLIWYVETHDFFEQHYAEIEELREDYEDQFGAPLQVKGDLKNWLAWFAFEETAFAIARDTLDLEL